MSAVAIDALRVDLTRLLLSARSTGSPDSSRTQDGSSSLQTSLFRRCKERSDEASRSSKKSDGSGDDVPQPCAPKAARLPLPEHVGRCVCFWWLLESNLHLATYYTPEDALFRSYRTLYHQSVKQSELACSICVHVQTVVLRRAL